MIGRGMGRRTLCLIPLPIIPLPFPMLHQDKTAVKKWGQKNFCFYISAPIFLTVVLFAGKAGSKAIFF
jgi:hypothetical protein